MQFTRLSIPNKEEEEEEEDEEDEEATRDVTREMSDSRSDGVNCVKQYPTLPPTAGARRRTNEPGIRMTATIAEKKAI